MSSGHRINLACTSSPCAIIAAWTSSTVSPSATKVPQPSQSSSCLAPYWEIGSVVSTCRSIHMSTQFGASTSCTPGLHETQAVQQCGDHRGGRPDVVPRSPPAQIALPHVTGGGIGRGHGRQLVVQGNVPARGDEEGAHEVEERPAQEESREGTT